MDRLSVVYKVSDFLLFKKNFSRLLFSPGSWRTAYKTTTSLSVSRNEVSYQNKHRDFHVLNFKVFISSKTWWKITIIKEKETADRSRKVKYHSRIIYVLLLSTIFHNALVSRKIFLDPFVVTPFCSNKLFKYFWNFPFVQRKVGSWKIVLFGHPSINRV